MNFLTKKRLIPGIIMLVLGLYIAYCGVEASVIGTKYGVGRAVALGGDNIILGLGGIVPGIIFICTSKNMPRKWIDYFAAVFGAICLLIVLTEYPRFGAGPINWIIFVIISVSLIYALPWSKKGYKNYHYPISDEQPHLTANNLEEIKTLKSLLDDGAITQEEYNKKKKQLLNL